MRSSRFRHFLLSAALCLSCLFPLAGLVFSSAGPSQAPGFPPTLPQGVASGDVTPTSAVLWTRSLAPGDLEVRWSTDVGFSSLAGSAVVAVTDTNIPVKAFISGLTAGLAYFYEVEDAAGATLRGRFRTPFPAGARSGLRFGVSGDWRGELAPYPAVANAAERDLDFFVALGDTIYGDYPSPALNKPSARTLEEYRLKHEEVYSHHLGVNTLAALRASTASFVQIDDHEVINDFAGGAPSGSDSRFDFSGAFINDSERYRDGLRAFAEYNPIENLVYTGTGDARLEGKPRLYRSRRFGSDAALFILDARSFRDAELPEVQDPTSPQQIGAYLARSFGINPLNGQPLPRRTFLGRAQVEDLKRDLLTAQQDGVLWKFVCVPEPIQNLGVVGASDRYEGYAAERTEILKFIDDNKVRNVVFVSADIHGTLVNNLTYQLGPGLPQIPTGSFEITTGSVAFDAPFGPTILDIAATIPFLGNLSLLDAFLLQLGVPNRAAFDAFLPRPAKDLAMRSLIDSQITVLGYSPLGLEDSAISSKLLKGGYVATFTYGWTEFEIDPTSFQLKVTTYGIDPYTAAQMNPVVATRVPEIVSQFTVDPVQPRLTITHEADSLRVSWPLVDSGYVLQQRSSLGGTEAWSDVTVQPVVQGDSRSVVLPAGGTAFLRLVLR